MRKTVLITGSSGQLGYRLCQDLSSHFNVIDTYRNHKSSKKKLDLTIKDDFSRIFSNYNPDVIINCAAITDLDYCEKNKTHCHSVNVEGLNRIISFSSINTKIIHISTDYVFDGKVGFYDEEHLTYPINYYGKCKLESENILIGSNKEYIIFRAGMLFDNRSDNFFTWILRNLREGKEIKVVSDMISNPTWIPSFSNVIMKSIYLDLSGLFHYGTDSPMSRLEFARLVADRFGYNKNLILPTTLEEIDFLAKRPRNTGLISSKISKQIEVNIDNIDYIMKILSEES